MLAAITYTSVIGVLLAFGGLLAEKALRASGRPTRWAWLTALTLVVSFLIVAAISTNGATGRSLLPADEGAAVSAVPAPVTGISAAGAALHVLHGARAAMEQLPQRMAGTLLAQVPGWIVSGLAVGWTVTSSVLLLMLLAVYLRFRRARGRWPVAELHGYLVRLAPDAGPAVMGMLRPEIVVPRWFLDSHPDEQRLVLSHEHEHVATGDQWLLAVGCICAAVIPWHPAGWWMLSRLRLAVEMDCDRRVLACGVTRRSYGAALIALATRHSRLPMGAAALASHATHLERRLLAMTSSPVTHPRSRALIFGAMSLLLVAAACEARLPTTPEIEQMDVAAAERRLLKGALPEDTVMVFRIDGVRVAAAAARAIAPEDIASIDVVRSASPAQRSSMNITTRAAAGRATHGGEADSGAALDSGTATARPRRISASDPMRLSQADRFEGLIFIDGRRVEHGELVRLDAATIHSIEVVKGAAAAKIHPDPAAAKGVIRVTTKAGAGAR